MAAPPKAPLHTVQLLKMSDRNRNDFFFSNKWQMGLIEIGMIFFQINGRWGSITIDAVYLNITEKTRLTYYHYYTPEVSPLELEMGT